MIIENNHLPKMYQITLRGMRMLIRNTIIYLEIVESLVLLQLKPAQQNRVVIRKVLGQ